METVKHNQQKEEEIDQIMHGLVEGAFRSCCMGGVAEKWVEEAFLPSGDG